MSIFRTLLGQLPSNRLPDDYEEVEWIKATGTQYINTGILTSGEMYFDIEYMLTSVSQFATIIGTDPSSTSQRIGFGLVENSRPQVNYIFAGNFFTMINNSNAGVNIKSRAKYEEGLLTITNEEHTITQAVSGTDMTASSTYPIYLFALDRRGSVTDNASARIYSAKIYSGTTLVGDFVPCYRKSDYVGGMYDLVSKQFFTNSGSGVFIYPREISITALTVDNGKYVDTGILPNKQTVVEMKFKATPRTVPSAKNDNMKWTQVAIGERYKWQNSEFCFWYDYAGSTWQTQAGSGSVIYSMGSTNNVNALASFPAWNKDCILTLQYGKFALNYDGENHEYTMTTNGSYGAYTQTLWLFNLHSNEGATCWFNGDWYYTKIWKDGVLVRDLVPAVDDNSVICMYDNVTQTYFYNSGTGDFGYK